MYSMYVFNTPNSEFSLIEQLTYLQQSTIAKKMAVCRFYRDPLRKVDSKCSKTIITLIWESKGIKSSENKFYPPKRMLNFS